MYYASNSIVKHSPEKVFPSTLVIEDYTAVHAPWLTVPPPQKVLYPYQTVEPDLSKANLGSNVAVNKLSVKLKPEPLQVDIVFKVRLHVGSVIFYHTHSLQSALINSK